MCVLFFIYFSFQIDDKKGKKKIKIHKKTFYLHATKSLKNMKIISFTTSIQKHKKKKYLHAFQDLITNLQNL